MIRLFRNVAGQRVIVLTHDQPHLDEIVALWLAERFGTLEFLEQYLEGNNGLKALMLGIPEGKHFDEHARENRAGQKDECCATLMAKALGIDRSQILRKLLEYVRSRDCEGGNQPLEFDRLVKLRNQRHPDEPEKVIVWTFSVLDDIYGEAVEFAAALTEFRANAVVHQLPGPNCTLRLAEIVSDNPQLHKAARSRGYDLVVIKSDKTGNVVILADKTRFRQLGITLDDVAYLLRLQERQVRDEFPVQSWYDLSSTQALVELCRDGTIAHAPEWFYHRVACQLLNGSHSMTDVPPTKIPLDDIVTIVKQGLARSVERAERQRQVVHRSNQSGQNGGRRDSIGRASTAEPATLAS